MVDVQDSRVYILINKYKQKLFESTNIENSKDEMNVIDDILFRFWQMRWLEALEASENHKAQEQRWIPVEERLPDKNCTCLVVLDFGKHKHTTVSIFRDGVFYNFKHYPQKRTKVIAWMPLPVYKGGAEKRNIEL